MQLDHITIRTTDLNASRDFFESFFDLIVRPRPRAIQHIPGYWLFAGNEPIVHLIGSVGSGFERSANAIDHVALRIDDYADFRTRLDDSNIPYSTMELPELNERRLFLRAPGGPLIEAVYREVEADVQPRGGATPDSASSDLHLSAQVNSGSVGEAA